jgi:hypothetical protein
MSLPSFTSASLKSLSKLIGKKDILLSQIAKIEAEIAAVITGKPVKAAKTSGKRRGRPARKVAAVKKSVPAKKSPKFGKKRAVRGGLGVKILKALETAGDAGVKVADLAKSLKVKGTNLHVWFATTGKKNAGIKKVGKGHYKLAGK